MSAVDPISFVSATGRADFVTIVTADPAAEPEARTLRSLMWNRIRHSLSLGLVGLCAMGISSCSLTWREPDPGALSLKGYVDAHFRELGTAFVDPMPRSDFLSQLRQTRVLYVGDHHRDPLLHEHILDLIDWICAQGMRPVIGMEAIGSQDNPGLQEFLSGGIEFEELHRRIAQRWPLSWLDRDGVDRTFFRELLRRTRQHQLDAFPLEPTPRFPLDQRDGVMAINIRRGLRLYPDRLIVVIVGHAHILGDGHLLGRVGAPSMTIAARFSESLSKALVRHPPVREDAFLRTDRGVLFFPPLSAERISDQ